MSVFKHVLAATDFSEASNAAIELAIAISKESGAGLTLLHTVEVPVFPEAIPPVDLITPLSDAAWARLGTLLTSVQARVPGARRLLKVGAAWEQILAAAGEINADLVVLGTHGRRGVSHALMGSVAERVVRLSNVPVLTVRSPAAR
jgi:nucleotide-binding universal stress UspA family protein